MTKKVAKNVFQQAAQRAMLDRGLYLDLQLWSYQIVTLERNS